MTSTRPSSRNRAGCGGARAPFSPPILCPFVTREDKSAAELLQGDSVELRRVSVASIRQPLVSIKEVLGV